MLTTEEAIKHVKRLGGLLDKQTRRNRRLDRYYTGDAPIPRAVIAAKATDAYKRLMVMAQNNWPELIVDSSEERLEVTGFRFKDKKSEEEAWRIWQANGLDADSGMSHQASLVSGRSYAIVWGAGDDVAITLEDGTCMYVEYEDATQRTVLRALRRWYDEGESRWHATLYTRDGLYKFSTKTTGKSASEWVRREVDGEDWPLPNTTSRVPVFELSVNRRLSMEHSKRARGEFESALPLLDRINYTVFSLMAAMTWSGFPLRLLIGEPIKREQVKDSNGDPVVGADGKPTTRAVKPFDVTQDSIAQVESKDAKLQQLPEAVLKNYLDTIEQQVRHLAAITKTPAHYMLGELVNVSADAIRSSEAGLISKIRRHQRALGEAWESVIRYALEISPKGDFPVDESAETVWRDPESRSLAERADAASKLAAHLPFPFLAQFVLGLSEQQIDELEALRGSDVLAAVVAEGVPGSDRQLPAAV